MEHAILGSDWVGSHGSGKHVPAHIRGILTRNEVENLALSKGILEQLPIDVKPIPSLL